MRAFFAALLLLLPAIAMAGPNTVAVVYFDNDGNPELDSLKVGLADMMITDLHGTEPFRIVERSHLQTILDELELGHSGIADASTAAKVGKLLAAEWVVFGSYMQMGDQLQLHARIVRVETTEMVHAEVIRDVPDEFFNLAGQLSEKIKVGLLANASTSTAPVEPVAPVPDTVPAPTRGGSVTPAPQAGATAAVTTDIVAADADALAAAMSFSEGLIFLDKKDVARARDSFEQAVQQDPNLDDARTQLATLDI